MSFVKEEDTIDEGSDDGSMDWDSEAAVAQRERLRHDPRVLEHIREAWQGCLTAAAAGGDAQTSQELGVSKASYYDLYRKLYLMQAVLIGQPDVKPKDCADIASEDWERDSAGGTHVDEKVWSEGWFEWIDMHTDSLDALAYVNCSTETLDGITKEGENGRIWRTDAELLQSIAESPEGQLAGIKLSSLNAMVTKWQKDVTAVMKKVLKPRPQGSGIARVAAQLRAPAPIAEEADKGFGKVATKPRKRSKEIPIPPPPPPVLKTPRPPPIKSIPEPNQKRKSKEVDVKEEPKPPAEDTVLSPKQVSIQESWKLKPAKGSELDVGQRAKVAYEKAVQRTSSSAKHLLGEGTPPQSSPSPTPTLPRPLLSPTEARLSHDASFKGSLRGSFKKLPHGEGGDENGGDGEGEGEGEGEEAEQLEGGDASGGGDADRSGSNSKAASRKASFKKPRSARIGESLDEMLDRSSSGSETDSEEEDERLGDAGHGGEGSRSRRRPRGAGRKRRGASADPDDSSTVGGGGAVTVAAVGEEPPAVEVPEPFVPEPFVPEPFEPLDDAQAIERLTNLVQTWDEHLNTTGLPPLLGTREGDRARQRAAAEHANEVKSAAEQMAAERTAALAVAAEKLTAERFAKNEAEATNARLAQIRQLARHCPSSALPPRPPDPPPLSAQRPVSARSPRSAQVARATHPRPSTAQTLSVQRRPETAKGAWPLPLSMVQGWIVDLESHPRLYEWWADGGHKTSPLSMTLPSILDEKGLARVARANGENALRAGYPQGAAAFFHKAAELAPIDAKLRWRLRECDSQLVGGSTMVKKVSTRPWLSESAQL